MPSAVATETWKLTPPDRRDVFESLTDVVIEDLGPTYRVVVSTPDGTSTRTYPGPDRDCARRARFAAVFIVLTLMPPDVPAPEPLPDLPPVVSPPVVVEPAPSLPSPPSPPVVRLELMAIADQGLHLGRANAVLCLGARLQTLLGRGAFTPVFGLGYAPPVLFDMGSVRTELARANAVVGVRAHRRLGELELGGQTAALVVLSRVTGTNLAHPATDSALELGVEVSGTIAWHASSILVPFIGLQAQWIPAPHTLIALPRGDLGTLPPLWLGASAGVALSL